VHLERKPLPKLRAELIKLFDRVELSKYMTEAELGDYDSLDATSKTEAE
jgi:succinate dehydrogenase flavoprotein subunit